MKDKTMFVCSECGNESLKWEGRCSNCGQWNTLKEFKVKSEKLKNKDKFSPAKVINLMEVKIEGFRRLDTKMPEVNRVLGEGIVPGTVVLLGGDPGIGKSTLVLQISSLINDTLYISGEESAQQLKLRANRLLIQTDKLNFLTETDIDEVITQISKLLPRSQAGKSQNLKLVVIDSIQTMYDSSYPSTPGSIVQVRECALRLQQLAKSLHLPIILVGHVTKEGSIAGPRILEHLVDVVLYLEGERYHETRILRGVKNRYGATDEIGVFEMTAKGLEELSNPSKTFLSERATGVSGSVVTATIEGTRPFLVEIQALTTNTIFGYPKRTASGFDLNRLNLLVAVLAKRLGLNLNSQDIYVNVVGGMRLKDPACDLAVCAAILSSYKNKALDEKLSLFGEVGLSGEIRSVSYEKKRIEEIKRLGFNYPGKINNINTLFKKIL